jgi:hypothetical protein
MRGLGFVTFIADLLSKKTFETKLNNRLNWPLVAITRLYGSYDAAFVHQGAVGNNRNRALLVF